ncbi:MAG: membrane dipeptidase [Myxococcota bacterium]
MLHYVDHRAAPDRWSHDLGVSREAVELYLASDVIDLHIDSFIWNRIFGYDLSRRHGRGLFGGRFYSQVDFPRILEAQVTGATWVITTNPFVPGARRRRALFQRNLERLKSIFAEVADQFSLVRNAAEYEEARRSGKHGAFIGVQGGNALDDDLASLDAVESDLILRITLVHLSTSSLGATSAPLKLGEDGLTSFGRDYVARLNEKKIFVDLAHISKRGFWDVIDVHDKSQPLLVTHTGVSGVHSHWRNLDDAQLRAIADTGGTIGVMYQSSFLGDPPWGGSASSILAHLEHITHTVGEDHASLGSDWDGAIVPPRDMPTCLELPRLVELMLQRGWDDTRIQKVLGQNFLRVVRDLRG